MTQTLDARFRNLDFEPVERRVLMRVAAEQWKRRARQEKVEQSGACAGEHECLCPNCQEFRMFWDGVYRAMNGGVLSKSEAMLVVGRRMTGGVVPTPWSDVAGTYGDR
jgi:hypothetical protein